MTEDQQYCQCRDNDCECGRVGCEILLCGKPLSRERMAEIFDEMRRRAKSVPVASLQFDA